jgi:hypothetical protein
MALPGDLHRPALRHGAAGGLFEVLGYFHGTPPW